MTTAEAVLWSRVRRKQLRGCQFYRQKIIGGYIVDFYCPSAGLVVKVDGGQHRFVETVPSGRVRDQYLTAQGLRTLRFTNAEVLGNIAGVVACIAGSMRLNAPHGKR